MSEFDHLSPLLAALDRRAERDPDRLCFFEAAGDGPPTGISYRRLVERVQSEAGRLARAAGPGRRIALSLPGGIDYVVTLLGCMAAGRVAVPLPPSRGIGSSAEDLMRHPVIRDAGAVAAITADGLVPLCDPGDPAAEPAPPGVALLQYTSGSTGSPKGVIVSHRNFAHNCAAIAEGTGLNEDDRGLVWLPPFHDMGLVGGILSPLWCGMSMTLLAPEAFARRPLTWLRLVSEGRMTMSGGPNFAFDACVDKIAPQDRTELDLSAWQVAFVGAEPVRARTLRRFAEAFAPAGFRPEAFYPCYGLAEATLIVTGGRRGGGLRTTPPAAPGRPEEVSCGRVLGGQELCVLDPGTGAPVPEGAVGEVVVAGPCVTGGYWRNPEATAASRTADGALRTGDLGRVVDGELYLTGRCKEMVVVRGRNLYPEDLEEVLHAADPALATGTAAAFGVPEADGEQLVVAVEISPRAGAGVRGGTDAGTDLGRAALLSRLRAAVARAAGVQPAAVLLCGRGALPRTTSGKVRRSACRELYLSGRLRIQAQDRYEPAAGYHAAARLPAFEEIDAVLPDERGPAVAAALGGWIAAATGVAPDPAAPLVAAGLDSLGLVQLQGDLAAGWGVRIELAELYQASSLSAAAAELAAGWDRAARPAGMAGPRSAADAGDPVSALAADSGFAYLEARHPGTSAHVLARGLRLAPDTDLAAIEAALQLLGTRHPALRGQGDEGPRIRLVRHDAAGLAAEAVEELVAEAATVPFDLAAGPLLRAEAVHTAEATLLVLAVHHAAADLWSASLLAAELAAAYRAFAAGVAPVLPEPGDPARAVAERRARIQGPRGARLRAWWAEHAAGGPPTVLPADRVRTEAPTLRSAAVSRILPDLAPDTVARFAAGLGTTPFTVFAAVLTAVLAGYGGVLDATGDAAQAWDTPDPEAGQRHDVVIGTPTSGRRDPAARAVVGFLANPVPVRTRVDGDPAFRELAARVHAAATAALEHQDLPFAAVVEAAGASRADGRNPLFDVLFVYHSPPHFAPPGTAVLAAGLPGATLDLGGLRARTAALPGPDTPVELTVEVAHTGTGTAAVLRYATDVFEASTATAMLEQYVAVLRAVLADPGLRVSDLNCALGETGPERAAEPGFCDVLTRVARAAGPDAVAVRQGPESVSYGALRRRADRLARRLRGLGVGPESIVAIALPRTLDLPVALLGVLAAGGAYCPLDTAAPPARLRAILDDARPAVILATRATRATIAALPAGPGAPDPVPVLLLDEEPTGPACAPAPGGAGPVGAPAPRPHPDQLSHVLFTSGSTGRPKGVALTHRGLSALADWAAEAYTGQERAGVLAGTALTFDLSVFELLATWCAGGTVVLADDALRLPRLRERDHVTMVNTVPSLAARLLADGLPAALRTVNLAGEPLPAELARALAAAGPERVENLYGPTEASTYATGARIDPADDRIVTVGSALPAVTATVRADGFRAVAHGVPGEVCLGGAHLARGYLGRPAMTARRFVPDPAAAEPGRRLYRTGDLARRRADGDLVYLGRADGQVKIRGVRIELGEIEAVLAAHPAVREAAVCVDRAGKTDAVLVAYVAGDIAPEPVRRADPAPIPAGSLDLADLRAYAAARLPGAMVPGGWVAVDRLPRTERGKIDRRALALIPRPAAAGAGALPGTLPAATRRYTAAEQVVAEVWGRLLPTAEPDPDLDFIAAGGHSLLAMQVLDALEERTGTRIPLDRMFAAPTIAGLARELAAVGAGSGAGQGTSEDDTPESGTAWPDESWPDESWSAELYPLTSTQERLYLLHSLAPGDAAYHLAARVRLTGPLDPARLERALQAVVDRHAGLRVRFVAGDGGEVRQQGAVTLPVRLPVRDVADEAAVAAIAEDCARAPFEPAVTAPWRVRLLRTGAQEHHLVFAAHHLICDGRSLELFVRDLRTAYNGDAPLSEAPASILDLALEARRRPADPPSVQWWRERLRDLPDLRLPADRPRSPDAARTARQVHCDLPSETVAALDAAARAAGATRFMAVTALVAALLGANCGQERFGLGVAVAGRVGPDQAEVFGCLADTVVLRADLTGAPSLAELLRRTRTELFDALAHADTPFADVVRVCAPGRTPATTPLFQVMLGDQPAALDFDLGPVRAATTPVFPGAAKFDLSVLIGPASAGGLRVTFECDDARFAPEAADRLPDRLARLLRAGLADPGAPLALAELTDPAERALLDRIGDGGPVPEPAPAWLHEAVLAPAAVVPDRIAIAAAGESVSHGALARRAAALAAGLRARGVGPEDRVAICHRRTVDLPAAMLGVLAAGAAYLPLRVDDPAERRADMLADAGAVLVLADPDTASWLDCEEVPVATLGEVIASAGGPAPASSAGPALIDPRQLAYVLYTSGSTGRPKGVAVTHQGASIRIAWARQAFSARELSGVLAATSLVFDLSLFELFAPLAAGGTVVLAESVLDLPTHPDRDRVALVTTVPSGMAALLDIDAWPDTVRTVGLGGEPLSPRLAGRVWERGPDRLVNLYGTTEDSFCSTWTELTPDAATTGVVTVGHPLPGSRIELVNAALTPVPPGVPGEIVSAGLGVSRGYLGRPGLTAAGYVPDPAGRPGDRRYRTGDRGRWLPAGLQVAGRLDQQVKIRGHRVEPAEVEAAVSALPAVAEAAVLAVPDRVGGKRLLACLRLRPEPRNPGDAEAIADIADSKDAEDAAAVAVEEIRAALRRRLPDYMVPGDFVFLAAMPRTASGKIDRAALAAAAPERAPVSRTGGEPPADGVESEVARVWQELIGVSRVARQDRFFDLGGDSLLAARMTARLNDRFGTEVSLRQIFEDDRLSAFAEEIHRAAGALS